VLVTNVLPAHLEGFGSLDVIAQTKGEIYQCLSEQATAILNVDDAYAPLWREFIGKHKSLTFGWQSEHKADVTARDVRSDDQGCAHFQLVMPRGEYPVSLQVPGFQNVNNALAAAAMAIAAGCDAAAIIRGLESFHSEPGRLGLCESASGCRLVDDTYNANPGSVRSAIDWLVQMPSPRVLILGEMAELGAEAQRYHEDIAEYAQRRGIEHLWVVGPHAQAMGRAFGSHAQVFADRAELIAYALEHVQADQTVLVKGSRRARMEYVVHALSTNNSEGMH
jgi:UDP-N-acetylmuramoyl-tripeptide--D-alanyl-D-alanine ligase